MSGPAKPAQRPLRDRVLWLLLGHGGFVEVAALAARAKSDEPAVLAALRELEAVCQAVTKEVAGVHLWRVAGPPMAREAGRELVRERLAMKVTARNEHGCYRMGVCRVVNQAPGKLGVLMAELEMPLEPDAAALQAVVDRFVDYALSEPEGVEP